MLGVLHAKIPLGVIDLKSIERVADGGAVLPFLLPRVEALRELPEDTPGEVLVPGVVVRVQQGVVPPEQLLVVEIHRPPEGEVDRRRGGDVDLSGGQVRGSSRVLPGLEPFDILLSQVITTIHDGL